MARDRLQLSPGVPDLRALGVAGVDELIDEKKLPSPRAVEIARDGAGSLVRMPLPGTVGPDGTRIELPRGAGTGWMRLRRFRGGSIAELLRARFTAPRSASLAERAWNVACHLRAHGVGTPDLIAVGARGSGLVARRSFLLTRELDGFESLKRWLAEDLSLDARRRGAQALGSALGKLVASGVVLPHLDARTIFLSIEPDAGGCLGEGGPVKNRFPSVVITALEHARIDPGDPKARTRALLRLLDQETRELVRSAMGADGPRGRLRTTLHAARAAGLDRAARHDLVASLAAEPPR